MSDSIPKPETVIERTIRRILGNVHTIRVGYIESYDAVHGEAFVQPADMAPFRNELGVRVPYQRKVIPHVPVYFPGGGGARDTWPIARGDACILLHCSVPIGRWSVSGGIVDEQNDTQRHDLGNTIALVGIADFGHFAPASTSARVVGEGASSVLVGGQDAAQAQLLGDAFLSALDDLVTTIGTAVGSIVGAPSGPIGAAAGTTIANALTSFQSAASTYKSQIVKVK